MTSGKVSEPAEDNLLSVIGQNGKWQFIIFMVVSVIGIPSAWNMLAITFLAPGNLDHWCAPAPGFEGWTAEQWKQYAIPTHQKDGVQRYEQCRMYDLDYSVVPADPDKPAAAVLNSTAVVACRTWQRADNSSQTYSYNLTRFKDTIINNFDLVCESSEMVAHAQSTYMVGVLLGAVLGGIFADWFGRRITLLLFTITLLVFGVATAFALSVTMFMTLRFLVAFSMMALFTTGFVYILEPVGGKWRAVYGISYEYPFAIGFMSLAAMAYLVNEWRHLQLFIIVPCIIFFVFFFVVPESPRWLLSRNREDEARAIIAKICTRNELVYKPSALVTDEISQSSRDETKGNIIDLFRTPNLRKRTVNFYYNWFVNSFVYYGLSLNSGDLGGDVFVNIFIAGAVEIPAYALSIFLLMKTGRRWPLCLTMVIGGAACLGTMIFEKNVYTLDWPIVTFAMIGKFCISASFAIVYVFSAEVYPTVVRTTGVGSCSMCARLGSISAPYISLYGRQVYRYLPVICFGVTSIVAGLLALLLPETQGKSLPDTIREGEVFGTKDEETKRVKSAIDHSVETTTI